MKKGFTLIEIVIVVAILGIIIGTAVPTILDVQLNTKASLAGSACRSIEAAKSLWKKNYPGVNIPSPESLNQFFLGGGFPKDPWNVSTDSAFLHVTDLSKATEHIHNGNCKYEPKGNCNATNGLNDSFQP